MDKLSVDTRGTAIKQLLERWSLPTEFIARYYDIDLEWIESELAKSEPIDPVLAAQIVATVEQILIRRNIMAEEAIYRALDFLQEYKFSPENTYAIPYQTFSKDYYLDEREQIEKDLEYKKYYDLHKTIFEDVPFETYLKVHESVFQYLQGRGLSRLKAVSGLENVYFEWKVFASAMEHVQAVADPERDKNIIDKVTNEAFTKLTENLEEDN